MQRSPRPHAPRSDLALFKDQTLRRRLSTYFGIDCCPCKTRRQNWPAETGAYFGVPVLRFATQRRAHASKRPRVRGPFPQEPKFSQKQGLAGWGARIRTPEFRDVGRPTRSGDRLCGIFFARRTGLPLHTERQCPHIDAGRLASSGSAPLATPPQRGFGGDGA